MSCITNLRKWLFPEIEPRPQQVTEKLIVGSLGMVKRHVIELEPGRWVIAREVRDNYRASLHLWADEWFVQMHVSSEVKIERDFIPRELLLTLLEDNHFERSSFRLVGNGDQLLVSLGRAVDARATTELELVHLYDALVERYQRMITKLLAMGVLIEGPHATDSSDDIASQF